MPYRAKTQTFPLLLLLFLMVSSVLSSSFRNSLSVEFLVFGILFCIFTFFTLFIHYECTIDSNYVSYRVLFFSWPLYKRTLSPNEIKQIKFKRVGWNTKGAIIKTKKGPQVRITHFTPEDVYTDLTNFAAAHNLSVYKTNDYLILDR
ncbi:hypothetical protein [Pontibacillus salipaludis]|uniref:hypothetical protein n=1 Tax=Pontibacillus salipaludis TaxID=1697394 RepID=UPI00166E6874|nr:hypothetical protein [Pontibacillus salipaludis]